MIDLILRGELLAVSPETKGKQIGEGRKMSTQWLRLQLQNIRRIYESLYV